MVGIDPNVISHKLNEDPTFKPIKQKRRKFAPERNKIFNDEVDNLLKTGKIREVKYPARMVSQRGRRTKEEWKMASLHRFHGSKQSLSKRSFPITSHRCYGSTYQRLVNMMFKEHLGRTMEVYTDDMLVKSERSIDHVAHLKQSFDILRQYKMKLNPTKCSFGVRAGKFLGYLVTQRGIEESPEQVKAITEIQSPRNIKEVQKLTGRVAALTRFISRSSDKCHLFYNVLRKNQGFLWTDEHEKALQVLKQYMASPPLLTKPVEGETLQLYLAVSKNAMSADNTKIVHDLEAVERKILVREEDQQQRPIYYVSKSFLDAETRYTSMEKLLLDGATEPELTGRLAKWSIYFSGFDIEFKPKTAIKSQALADFVAEFSPGLEPTTCDEVNKVMISDNKPWLLYVEGGNIVYSIRCEFKATNNEAEYEALIAGLDITLRLGAKQLHVRSDSLLVVNQINGDFQAKDSKMMSYLKAVKDRIAQFEHFLIKQIPRDLNMQADALANLGSAFHDPSMENIPILHLTTPTIEAKDEAQMNEEIYNWLLDVWNYLKYDRLPEDKMEARKTRGRSLANRISRQGYYWPTLREDAIRYVRHCDACQKHSGMTHRPSEPLHSVLIPWPFMRWGMDIVGKLPPAPGQKVYLLVLTDYFSKWVEAGAFLQLVTSTPRYPQSNGLAESSNKVIINSIRKRLKGEKRQTPYSLVYGCEAVLPIEAQIPVARNRTFDQNAINLSYDLDALEELRENALRTMAAQKGLVERHFNKKVKAKIFQVGDYVLRHMFQNTREPNAGKLSIKWEGPYVISKVIGNGAYQLTTMEGTEIPRSWNAHHLKMYYF
ncbi:hypothetical protein OSB04_005751 [Centaurea solstitialis]|uniref:Uncharacterized protein n=1 Tax=Centaurea solstitialis TaxID=347529 RepID=A0AA38TS79_9ASTR|nr:hypothetical protein OSB04_005751 [Centaurea solstitialis]